MAKTDFQSVDDYIASMPEAVQPALQRVRAILREALPEAEEAIGYQIPMFRLHGTYGLYFAGYTAHYSLYPVTAGVLAALGDELAPYLSGKATIRFPLAEPMPEDLIRRIATCRAKEIGAAPKKPAAKKKPPAP
jgi:uncharacterized protein YdhG (YjbR/CyaY superfamily)